MATVEVSIEYALLARLADFGAANSITIAQPNVPFTPPTPEAGNKWLRPTFLPNETVGLGISYDSYNQHFGLLQVDVFYPFGRGEIEVARTASALIAYFKRDTTVTKDGFTAQIWKPPFRGPMIKDEPNPWVFIPVRIPYLCLAINPA